MTLHKLRVATTRSRILRASLLPGLGKAAQQGGLAMSLGRPHWVGTGWDRRRGKKLGRCSDDERTP